MPQLDKVTFLSQFFWLCFFYFGFYYILSKYFLPKLSRILALRKRKLHASHEGLQSTAGENSQVRHEINTLVAQTVGVSKTMFQTFFRQNTAWVDTTVNTLHETHYKPVYQSYMDLIGENAVSQRVVVYHASPPYPEKFAVKILLDTMKHLPKTGSHL